MKKLVVFLCVSLLLCGCGSRVDAQVESVREQILALPSVEDFQTMTLDRQSEGYVHVQSVYESYMALTEAQRQQISQAQEIFGDLFAWFNAQVQPLVPETEPEPETIPETTEPDVVILSEEDQTLLLKIAMAERGETGCTECLALVMRTVLNRVESDRFAGTVRKVLYSQDQFTPVMDGSFETAEPNDACREALQMVIKGWDESQGAFFYEWCEGESWHSKNLKLLLQHCDTRFYQ